MTPAHLALAEQGDGLLQLPQELLDFLHIGRHHRCTQPSSLLHLCNQPRLPVCRLPARGRQLERVRSLLARQVDVACRLACCEGCGGIERWRRRRAAVLRHSILCVLHDVVGGCWLTQAVVIGHGTARAAAAGATGQLGAF